MGLVGDVSRKRPARRLRRTLGFLLYNIATVLVLSLMFEGAASTYYAFRNTFAEPPVAESLYTQYDRELGWVSLPNVYLPNMYGPGNSCGPTRSARPGAGQNQPGVVYYERDVGARP